MSIYESRNLMYLGHVAVHLSGIKLAIFAQMVYFMIQGIHATRPENETTAHRTAK